MHDIEAHRVRVLDLRAADFKNIILRMFGNREFYGYEIHRMLAAEGLDVEIGRLYRILNEMSKEELIEGRWAKSQFGPNRRVYKLGVSGKSNLNKILLDAIVTVHSFYGLYLASLAPKLNIFESIVTPFVDGLVGNENIALVTEKYSPMYDAILSHLHEKVPQGKIFLVKPNSVQVDLRLGNLLLMDGSYGDIPLKDDYVNLLLAIDLPNQDALKNAVKEWVRVINQKGKLAILTPTILISKFDDPMSIGDFVEKNEHEAIEKGVHIDKEQLQTLLNSLFSVVHERELVHMTTFVASQRKQVAR
ncbi:PadR family transcriptional regulator [Candidatus Bathyarchaeota archaeon]|nr:PadR family transcriptional regulator [Candidatus Bathyarchaeota archaeon]